jgi:hypothetical protein
VTQEGLSKETAVAQVLLPLPQTKVKTKNSFDVTFAYDDEYPRPTITQFTLHNPEHLRSNFRKHQTDPADSTDSPCLHTTPPWLQPPVPRALHVPHNIDVKHQNEAGGHLLTRGSCLKNSYNPTFETVQSSTQPESFLCVKSQLDPRSKKEKDSFDVTPVYDDEQFQAHKVILHHEPTLKLMHHGEGNMTQEEPNLPFTAANDLRAKGPTQNRSPTPTAITLSPTSIYPSQDKNPSQPHSEIPDPPPHCPHYD